MKWTWQTFDRVVNTFTAASSVILAAAGVWLTFEYEERNREISLNSYVNEHFKGWMVVYESYRCNDGDCALVDGLKCEYSQFRDCGTPLVGGVSALADRLAEFDEHNIPAHLVPSQFHPSGTVWLVVSPSLDVEGREEGCRQAGLMLTGQAKSAANFEWMYGSRPPSPPAEWMNGLSPHIAAMKRVLGLEEEGPLLKAGFKSPVPCGTSQVFFWHKPNLAVHRDYYGRLLKRTRGY